MKPRLKGMQKILTASARRKQILRSKIYAEPYMNRSLLMKLINPFGMTSAYISRMINIVPMNSCTCVNRKLMHWVHHGSWVAILQKMTLK